MARQSPHWASWWPGRVLQSCRRHRSGHRATRHHGPTLLSAPSLCVALTPPGQRSSCGCLCVSPLPSASVFLWYCVLALLTSCGLAHDWTCRWPCMLVAITDELGPPARNHLVTILLLLCFPACFWILRVEPVHSLLPVVPTLLTLGCLRWRQSIFTPRIM